MANGRERELITALPPDVPEAVTPPREEAATREQTHQPEGPDAQIFFE